jgi:endonuclease/exonuclease/phosphatase family metal-dependent hydrolase
MKFLNFFASLLLTLYASADTECPVVSSFDDRRSNKNSLRLVQYNVEWLFIDYCTSSDCPGNGCSWKTQTDAQTHLSHVTKVIDELQPDIINFCEVEGCDELQDVVNALEKGSSYKYYLKKGTDTSTGQNVGMLTKIDPLVNLYRTESKVSYPIPGSTCGYTGTGTTGVSKHYITEFNLGGMKVAMIGAHFIAIPTDPIRCAQREGQAQVLQYVVSDYIAKGFEVILLGDMNDFDSEVLDMNSDKPISKTLQILKGMAGEKKGTYSLTNVASKMNQSERYSDWYDSDNNCNTSSQKDYSMIDHVLVSSKIEKNIASVSMYHGYKEYCGKWDSDHYPVVIDFSF